MAWVCDYCRQPPAPWSGGQGPREHCETPGCPGNGEPQEAEPRRIAVMLTVTEPMARDVPEEDLAAVLGAEAASRVKQLLEREDAERT